MNIFPLIPDVDVTALPMAKHTAALLALGLISGPALLWEFTQKENAA